MSIPHTFAENEMNKTVPANCANAHDCLAIVLRVQPDASNAIPISGKSKRVSELCCSK